MTSDKPLKVLFLCTGNSARSIFGEFIMNSIGGGKFEAYSAGAFPKDAPHPLTLKTLKEKLKIDPSGAYSKSADSLVEKGIEFDFVITVCDDAKENCPIWPGQPMVCHWSSPDPAAFEGTVEETERFFYSVAMLMRRRIELFSSIPFAKLDRFRLQKETEDIAEKETMETPVS